MSSQLPGKRKHEDEDDEDNDEMAGGGVEEASSKVFSAAELRQKLKTLEAVSSLKTYFKLNCDEDRVGDYIDAGGSVDELLSVLVKLDVKKNRRQAIFVFNALHHVINKIMNDHEEHVDELISSCKQLVAGYLSSLMALLAPDSGVTSRKVALKLLTAVSNINDYFSGQILSSLDLSYELCQSLAEHYRPNDLDSVRSAYVSFLFSFIVNRSHVLIKKFISKKGILSSIFAGFQHDPRALIERVLASLHMNIIQNKELSRNHKLAVFNTHNILHLVEVYAWNPYDMKNTNKNYKGVCTTEVNVDDLNAVRDAVHKLLLELLTSSKLGVVFYDPSYGTSSKKFCNQLLATIIQRMVQPWEDPLQCELVMEVFLKCPDLFGQVFSHFFDPYIQSPFKFVKAVTFIRKVIKRMKVDISNINTKGCVRLAQWLFVPHSLVKRISDKQFLVAAEQKTRLAALKTIVVCLKRLSDFNNSVEKIHPDSSHYKSAMTQYIINNFSDGSTLFKMFDQIVKEADTKSFCKVGAVCLLYNTVCPQLLDNIRYQNEMLDVLNMSMKRLSADCDDTVSNSIIIRTVQLSVIISPSEGSTSDAKSSVCERVKMVCGALSSSGGHILRAGLEVLAELLEGTGLLSGCEHEVALWGPSPILPPAIEAALLNLNALYALINRADTPDSRFVPDQTSADLDLDDFIKLSINNTNQCSKLQRGGMYSGLNVSPLLVATLQMVSEESFLVDTEVQDYVRTILVHLFHYQKSVEGFVNMLKMFSKNDTVAGVLQYAESWCSVSNIGGAQAPAVLDLMPFSGENVHHQISRCLLADDFDIDQLLQKLEAEEERSRELCLAQTVFSVCQLANLKLATSSRVDRAAALVHLLLHRVSGRAASLVVDHPVLLRYFHPVRTAKHSNLTRFVMEIVRAAGSTAAVQQYSERLVFELKYAMRKKREIKFDNLAELLELFPLKEQDIKDLLEQLLNYDFSYLLDSEMNNFSAWMKLEMELLENANRSQISLESYQMILLCRQLTHLANKSVDIGPLSPAVLRNFKISPEMYADNNDLEWTFGELLLAIGDDGWIAWCWLASVLKSDNAWRQLADSQGASVVNDRRLLGIVLAAGVPSPLAAVKSLVKHLVKGDSFVDLTVQVLLSTPSWSENISSLIPFLSSDKCKEICKTVKQHKKNILINESSLKFLEGIFTKCCRSDALIKLVEYWLLEALTNDGSKSQEILIMSLVASVACHDVKENENSDDSDNIDMESSSVNVRLSPELVKLLIDKGLSGSKALCLYAAAKFIGANIVEQTSAEKIFRLVTSHPDFLSIVVSGSGRTKFEALKLLLESVKKDNSLMKSEDVPVYLAAYNATLSSTDRVILQLLQMYEDRGVWLKKEEGSNSGRLYLWGETATRQYNVFDKKPAANQKKHHVFLTDTGINPLDLLDISVVHSTISNFPIERELKDMNEISYEEEDENSEEGRDRYDPAFVLAVLGQVVECGGDRRRVVESGALSLMVASLSSQCPLIRGAAYYLLHTVASLLFDTKENLLLVHFMDALRSGIKSIPSDSGGQKDANVEDIDDDSSISNVQLSSILTVFLSRSVLILNDLFHPMYKAIVNFFVAKPTINLNTVPAFFELFNSTHSERNVHQQWILKVLRDGIRLPSDLRLALNCYVFKIILDFHSSSLASDEAKNLIEEIVSKCIFKVDVVQKLLVKEYSLLAWISDNINSNSSRGRTMSAVTSQLLPNSQSSTNCFGSSYNQLCKHIYHKEDSLKNVKPVSA